MESSNPAAAFYATERLSVRITPADKRRFGALCTGPDRVFRDWTRMVQRALQLLYDTYADQLTKEDLFNGTPETPVAGGGSDSVIVEPEGPVAVLGIRGTNPTPSARPPYDRRGAVKGSGKKKKAAKRGKS